MGSRLLGTAATITPLKTFEEITMKTQFADPFAQLKNTTVTESNGSLEVVELTPLEISAVGGGEAITNVY